MKPPNPKRNGGPVSRTAACVKPKRPSSDKLDESVNDLEVITLDVWQAARRALV